MLAARAEVALALGADTADVPPLTDPTTQLAADAIAADAGWRARIDAAIAGGVR